MSQWTEFLSESRDARQVRDGLERQIDFARWGFHIAYAGATPVYDVVLVYQSERCRVRFSYSRGRYASPRGKVGEGMEEGLSHAYGRVHAPDQGDTLPYEGQELVAWQATPNSSTSSSIGRVGLPLKT